MVYRGFMEGCWRVMDGLWRVMDGLWRVIGGLWMVYGVIGGLWMVYMGYWKVGDGATMVKEKLKFSGRFGVIYKVQWRFRGGCGGRVCLVSLRRRAFTFKMLRVVQMRLHPFQ